MPLVFRPTALVRADLEARFPNLAGTKWAIRSPFNDTYQCIAWAACDTTRKWWPIVHPPEAYWPPTAPMEETVDSFVQAFATLGYKPCKDVSFEFGYQKVAIYADDEMTTTHMARQHFFGRGWLSKLGNLEDILHRQLRDVEGDTAPASQEYGKVVQVLKRSWWVAARLGLFRGCLASFKFWFYRVFHNY